MIIIRFLFNRYGKVKPIIWIFFYSPNLFHKSIEINGKYIPFRLVVFTCDLIMVGRYHDLKRKLLFRVMHAQKFDEAVDIF